MDPVEVQERRTNVMGRGVVSQTPGTVTEVPAATTTVRTAGVYPLAYRAVSVVWLIVGLINTILAFDFFFRLANANDVGFANFIYSVGGALAAPFDGIFGISRTVATQSIVRWSDLLAMIVYTLVAYAVVKIVRIAAAPSDRAVA